MKNILLDYVKALKREDKEKQRELETLIPKDIREGIKEILIEGKTDPKALKRKRRFKKTERLTLIEKRKELENELKNWNDVLFLVMCGVFKMYPEAIDTLKKYIQSIETELNIFKQSHNI